MSSFKKHVKRAYQKALKKNINDISTINKKTIVPFSDWDIIIAELGLINSALSSSEVYLLFLKKVKSHPDWTKSSSYKKGLLSEFYVDLVLRSLKKNSLIHGYMSTVRNGRYDKKGIDVILSVVGQRYLWLPLQVKSSWRFQKKHFHKTEKLNTEISSVVATPVLSKLYKKLKTIIEFKIMRAETVHI